MSGMKNEEGFFAENERKSRRNARLVFALLVLGVIGLATSWYLKVGPFNKPVPAPTPAKVAATLPPPAPSPTPSATPTKDAKAPAAKPKHTKKR